MEQPPTDEPSTPALARRHWHRARAELLRAHSRALHDQAATLARVAAALDAEADALLALAGSAAPEPAPGPSHPA